MSLFIKDYKKLYHLQDKFLSWWKTLGFPFYLTGGTALGRFYLNHRFSEDLDFFVNANPDYLKYIAVLKDKIVKHFSTDIQKALFSDDFTRLFITEDDLMLKIELVNDVEYYSGNPATYNFGRIDTPLNILANKLTAIIGRDEPKDIFDIIHISLNYSFNWPEIFYHAKQKSVINELDVEKRLSTFPIEWLNNVSWLNSSVDLDNFAKLLKQIADDFLLGRENSLGTSKAQIEIALPQHDGR